MSGIHDDDDGIYHHVDYRSKADMRMKELEELRKRSLAHSQAARLADAEAPTTDMMLHFQEKQKQLFQEQRRNQAAAREYLHRYRADDERILTEQRRSSAGRGGGATGGLDHPGGGRPPVLTPPDARAAVYPRTTDDSPPARAPEPTHRDGSVPSDMPLRPDTAPTDRFAIRHETLEMTYDAPGPSGNETDVNHLIICEGCTAEEDQPPVTTTSTIPFESFLKLGESQIMAGKQPLDNHDMMAASTTILEGSGDENNFADSDGDDSIIPIESFMKLGASMMAEAMGGSRSEDDDEKRYKNNHHSEDDVTASLTDPGQSHMEDSSSLAASMCQPQPGNGTSIHHPTLTKTITTITNSNTSPIHETEIKNQRAENAEIKEQFGSRSPAVNVKDSVVATNCKSEGSVDTQPPPAVASQEQVESTASNESEMEETRTTEEVSREAPHITDECVAVTNETHVSNTELLKDYSHAVNDSESSLKEPSFVDENATSAESNCAGDVVLDNPESAGEHISMHVKNTEKIPTNAPCEVQYSEEEHKDEVSPIESTTNVSNDVAPDEPTNVCDFDTSEVPENQDEIVVKLTAVEIAREESVEIVQTNEVVEIASTPSPNVEAEVQRRRRRKKKTKVGYYPMSSHFVSRHYFSR